MDTFQSYKNDGTLKSSCRKALDFFKKEAAMIESISDYYLKTEDFEKLKKNFECNSEV